jgi:hypothetical protein
VLDICPVTPEVILEEIAVRMFGKLTGETMPHTVY